MRRLALLLSLCPSVALAQPEARRPDTSMHRAARIYGADDPTAPLKLRVEQLMGVYLVDPPRRHPTERVTMKGGQVRVTYWQTVGGATDDELLARAVQWFVFGRTQYATGARGVFGELPAVDRVALVFEDVVRPERKGRRRGDERVREYLTLEMSRAKFEKLDAAALDRVRECVRKVRCGPVARDLFDRARFDRGYARSRAGR